MVFPHRKPSLSVAPCLRVSVRTNWSAPSHPGYWRWPAFFQFNVSSRHPLTSDVMPPRDWKSSKSHHEEHEEREGWNSTISRVDEMKPIHQAQLVTSMKLSDVKIGLLINLNVTILKDGIRRFKVSPAADTRNTGCTLAGQERLRISRFPFEMGSAAAYCSVVSRCASHTGCRCFFHGRISCSMMCRKLS